MKRSPKGGFAAPLNKFETVIGFFLLAIHMFALPPLLNWLTRSGSWNLTAAQVNLVYYGVSFVLTVAFLFRFLRLSFPRFFKNFGGTVSTIVLAFVAYYALSYLVSLVQNLLSGNFSLPPIGGAGKLNRDVLTIISLLLAPVAEEVLFRGVAFGVTRKSSRIFAYIFSLILFSVYHIFWDAVGSFSWSLLWTALHFLPASLVLCWSYERSGSIWTPIVLHILFNCLSLVVTIG